MNDSVRMNLGRLRNLQVDRSSNCQSLGSNRQTHGQTWNQMGSQSRKMSIGIVADSLSQPVSRSEEQDEDLLPSGVKGRPNGDPVELKNEKQEVQYSGKENQRDAETEELPDVAKKPSDVPVSGTYEQKAGCSLHFVASQAISEENDTAVTMQDYAPFDAAPKVCFLEKPVLHDRTNLPENTSKDILIMNLWETLGAASSPKNQFSNSEKIEASTHASPNKQLPNPATNEARSYASPNKLFSNDQKIKAHTHDVNGVQDKFGRPSEPYQSSDTIESDSESPVRPITRAVTRCLLKKRASHKIHPQNTAKKQATTAIMESNKVKHNQSSVDKIRRQKNAFPFDEKWFSINPNAITASSVYKRNSEKKRGKTKRTGNLHPAEDMGKYLLSEHTTTRPTSAESKRAKKIDNLPPAEDMGKHMLSEHITTRSTPTESEKYVPLTEKHTNVSHSSLKFKGKLGDLDGPTSPKNVEPQTQFCGQSRPGNDRQCDNIRGPELKMKAAAPSPFPDPLSQVNVMEDHNCIPAGGKPKCFVRDTITLGRKLPGTPNTSVMGTQRENSICSSKMKYHSGVAEGTTSIDNAEKQTHSQSLHAIASASYAFRSPELQMKTAAQSPSCNSLPFVNENGNRYNGHTHEEAEIFISKFHTRLTRTQDNSGSDAAESSDTTVHIKDSSTSTPVELTGEENEEDGHFTSNMQYLDSPEDDNVASKGFTEDLYMFPEIHLMQKPYCNRNKHLQIHEDNNRVHVEADDMMVASEQTAEDELSRAVAIFGLALEKIKGKLMSALKKRCLDILTSSGEEIHQHLQILEFHIQNDIGKLTEKSKSKRKSLETRFQELQEQLEIMNHKFKEDIDHHLQDCRNTVEELEVEETELRRAIERQKASHRKLLLQVEDAVQNQLTDVQKKITSVHQSGQEKMLQLKLAISECLKDSICMR